MSYFFAFLLFWALLCLVVGAKKVLFLAHCTRTVMELGRSRNIKRSVQKAKKTPTSSSSRLSSYASWGCLLGRQLPPPRLSSTTTSSSSAWSFSFVFFVASRLLPCICVLPCRKSQARMVPVVTTYRCRRRLSCHREMPMKTAINKVCARPLESEEREAARECGSMPKKGMMGEY